MAELTLTTFVTLDGVMQAPGGPQEDTSGGFRHGGWVFPLADADMGNLIVDIFGKADAFLLGRGTYDLFAAHWPRVTDPNDPVAHRLNTLPKYVASRTRATFDWNNTAHVNDVVADVAVLKRTYAREVQVHGSAGLIQTLLEHDLIDEYRLFVFPVTVGGGKRLFGSGTLPATFALKQTRITGSGAVFAAYRRAGPLRTGSFALE